MLWLVYDRQSLLFTACITMYRGDDLIFRFDISERILLSNPGRYFAVNHDWRDYKFVSPIELQLVYWRGCVILLRAFAVTSTCSTAECPWKSMMSWKWQWSKNHFILRLFIQFWPLQIFPEINISFEAYWATLLNLKSGFFTKGSTKQASKHNYQIRSAFSSCYSVIEGIRLRYARNQIFGFKVDAFVEAGATALWTSACFSARAVTKIVCFENTFFLWEAVGYFQAKDECLLCFNSWYKISPNFFFTSMKKWDQASSCFWPRNLARRYLNFIKIPLRVFKMSTFFNFKHWNKKLKVVFLM